MTARAMAWGGPAAARLAGNRLHLAHGPIDLVIRADGPSASVERAYRAAGAAFAGLLESLVAVLPRLRAPVGSAAGLPPAARLMQAATAPLATDLFVTPMAAVAGAVADTVMTAIRAVPGIERAYVNNRGDIAVHLTPGTSIEIGVVPELRRPLMAASLRLRHDDGIGGVATSGWDGRSFSLGIADAVTVLAASAAQADAAATLIANAVDVDDPAINRLPATELDPDSDLGRLLVTTGVGVLDDAAIAAALDNGARYAQTLLERRLISAAMLVLEGRARIVGTIRGEIACSS
jgi:ApbE superfamily uncharacterized protein (UPF0280 family)